MEQNTSAWPDGTGSATVFTGTFDLHVASAFSDQLFDGHIEAWRLGLCSFLCWVITSLSVAAGIGGGGLLVPLYSIVLALGPKLAVPVSKATIFGVAVGNLPFIITQRHPDANRPLIDYNIVTLMQPGVLLGVVMGVLLNLLLPEIAIVALLAVVLGLTGYMTLKKGAKLWAAESKAAALAAKGAPLADDEPPAAPTPVPTRACAYEPTAANGQAAAYGPTATHMDAKPAAKLAALGLVLAQARSVGPLELDDPYAVADDAEAGTAQVRERVPFILLAPRSFQVGSMTEDNQA